MQKMNVRGAAAPVTSLPTWPESIAIPGREDLAIGRAALLAYVSLQDRSGSEVGLDHHLGHATLAALLQRCGETRRAPAPMLNNAPPSAAHTGRWSER
jgi:hypothetical protein